MRTWCILGILQTITYFFPILQISTIFLIFYIYICNSYESGILENPDQEAPETLYQMTASAEAAPSDPAILEINFEKGMSNYSLQCKQLLDSVNFLVTGNPTSLKIPQTEELITEPLNVFTRLNEIAGRHGIGRIDIVENRFLGLKVIIY